MTRDKEAIAMAPTIVYVPPFLYVCVRMCVSRTCLQLNVDKYLRMMDRVACVCVYMSSYIHMITCPGIDSAGQKC